ncbi:hypothetical protein CYMTET_17618 [Cymbomonas tetramitiformis]|uniref:Uncharacterized protein n=1 Tax=Cymbomonas tetramitiformis TaxID=36881 RepID=A0AAE0L6Y8_9CHLO|nr:hypothetical protein CYMTET_17618 [Cymbomonas tetramitiformis]
MVYDNYHNTANVFTTTASHRFSSARGGKSKVVPPYLQHNYHETEKVETAPYNVAHAEVLARWERDDTVNSTLKKMEAASHRAHLHRGAYPTTSDLMQPEQENVGDLWKETKPTRMVTVQKENNSEKAGLSSRQYANAQGYTRQGLPISSDWLGRNVH